MKTKTRKQNRRLTIKALQRFIRNALVVWYGPHTCYGCGRMIVKSSIVSGGIALDWYHNSYYPNHVWKQHRCKGGAPQPVKQLFATPTEAAPESTN